MLPTGATCPEDKNSTALAIRGRSSCVPPSARPHTSRACLSAPVQTVHLGGGNRDHVNMVGHQAIANQRHTVEFNVLSQQIEMNHAISVEVQDKSPRIPTLRHMVRNINRHDPSQARHGSHAIRKRSVCPRIPPAFPSPHSPVPAFPIPAFPIQPIRLPQAARPRPEGRPAVVIVAVPV